MLELRPSCEHCSKPLLPDSHKTRICADRTVPGGTWRSISRQTRKPQPFLVPMARQADGDEDALLRRWGSQLAALDGVSWIMGTLFYSAEYSRKGMPAPARQRR
jgi:hypothetical protein